MLARVPGLVSDRLGSALSDKGNLPSRPCIQPGSVKEKPGASVAGEGRFGVVEAKLTN